METEIRKVSNKSGKRGQNPVSGSTIKMEIKTIILGELISNVATKTVMAIRTEDCIGVQNVRLHLLQKASVGVTNWLNLQMQDFFHRESSKDQSVVSYDAFLSDYFVSGAGPAVCFLKQNYRNDTTSETEIEMPKMLQTVLDMKANLIESQLEMVYEKAGKDMLTLGCILNIIQETKCNYGEYISDCDIDIEVIFKSQVEKRLKIAYGRFIKETERLLKTPTEKRRSPISEKESKDYFVQWETSRNVLCVLYFGGDEPEIVYRSTFTDDERETLKESFDDAIEFLNERLEEYQYCNEEFTNYLIETIEDGYYREKQLSEKLNLYWQDSGFAKKFARDDLHNGKNYATVKIDLAKCEIEWNAFYKIDTEETHKTELVLHAGIHPDDANKICTLIRKKAVETFRCYAEAIFFKNIKVEPYLADKFLDDSVKKDHVGEIQDAMQKVLDSETGGAYSLGLYGSESGYLCKVTNKTDQSEWHDIEIKVPKSLLWYIEN